MKGIPVIIEEGESWNLPPPMWGDKTTLHALRGDHESVPLSQQKIPPPFLAKRKAFLVARVISRVSLDGLRKKRGCSYSDAEQRRRAGELISFPGASRLKIKWNGRFVAETDTRDYKKSGVNMTLKTYAIGSTSGIKRCKFPCFLFFSLWIFLPYSTIWTPGTPWMGSLVACDITCLVGLWLRDKF